VGEVYEKAKVLQSLKVNDWIESEKMRLGHLRDRASDMGRRKEYPSSCHSFISINIYLSLYFFKSSLWDFNHIVLAKNKYIILRKYSQIQWHYFCIKLVHALLCILLLN
jgi:hypothetical protein